MFFYPMQDFSLVHVCLLVLTEPVSNVCSPNCEPWSGSIFKQYPLLYKTQFSSTTHNSSTIFKQYQSNILYFIQHNFELTPSVGSVASHLWHTNSWTTKLWTVKCVNQSGVKGWKFSCWATFWNCFKSRFLDQDTQSIASQKKKKKKATSVLHSVQCWPCNRCSKIMIFELKWKGGRQVVRLTWPIVLAQRNTINGGKVAPNSAQICNIASAGPTFACKLQIRIVIFENYVFTGLQLLILSFWTFSIFIFSTGRSMASK